MNDPILELISQLRNEKNVGVRNDHSSQASSLESDGQVSENHSSDDDGDCDIVGSEGPSNDDFA